MTGSDDELRLARRDRVFAAMDAAGYDVFVLGRRDSVAYATGARSLWTAGTRPFGAACVLVAASRATYLLSSWDAGVPSEVPFEHLYGVTWNPATMAAALDAIPGLRDARRIGVDAISPGFTRAASRLAPDAELYPVDDLLRSLRAVKLPAEIERCRAAVAVCRAAVAAVTEALAAGATPAGALATIHRTLASHGATIPATPPTVTVTPTLTHIDVSILLDAYEGTHARTLLTPNSPAAVAAAGVDDGDPSAAVQRALLEACRDGATADDLRAAAGSATSWLVRGSGMGFEGPVISATLGGGARLVSGMVLSVEVEVEGFRRRDLAVVHTTADLL
jgi:Xaa-Pro aminopeptidase